MAFGATHLPDDHPRPSGSARPKAGRQVLAHALGLPGTTIVYARKQEIFGQGEEARSVFRVISGAVRSDTILTDGRRQVGSFHLANDLFGFVSGSVHHQSAEAMVETRVTVYPRRLFEAAARHDVDLALELWTMALLQLEHQQDHVLLLGRRSALERVAAFLQDVEQRVGTPGWFALPMTRRDIADYLGLTVETVSRALSLLEAEGALVRGGTRRIRLCHGTIRQILRD